MILDEATRRQVEAANPRANTWLSANAGSGKTRVLTDRVARLLLDGVPPDHILCLTYTKAAATEMQNRLFRRLGEWAMLEDDALNAALQALGVARDADGLRDARTLFARAIETPGGLRIQTIHSFCAALLRRFPLEAGVSPQFTEIEDRAGELLRQELLDQMAEGPMAGELADVARHDTSGELEPLTAEVVNKRLDFAAPQDRESLAALYGISADTTVQTVLDTVFLGGEVALIQSLLPHLVKSGGNDEKAAAKLQAVKAPDMAALQVLESVFLTGSGAKSPFSAKIGSFPKKALQNGDLAPVMPQLESLMLRVEAARETRLAVAALERDIVLHRFAGAFLPLYAAEKQRRGWLDFDDLIERTNALLQNPAVASWVLYKLDGGIDHILVDEAQDTSPGQWLMIDRLAREFTAGEGARSDVSRTLFVVGDKKQSIYSFQGANAAAFDQMRDAFKARLKRSENPLNPLTLEHSFRSAAPVLGLVDAVFDGRVPSGFVPEEKHRAFKSEMPGRVDLWPLVSKVEDPEKPDWYAPVDHVSAQHHTVILAQRVAHHIKRLLDTGHPLPQEIGHSGKYAARPVRPDDFLILVRRRSRLFAEIIRACKQMGLPIAGADRLKVTAELAVRDIAALLSFLATPEDDLSLAVALRSPLFGLDEQAIYDLAQGRGGAFLWATLRERRLDMVPVLEVLDDLRNNADFLRPYDLIERILTRHNGRRLLLGRLGDEAEDGIDALLHQALAYERTAVPSLTGFLQWMQTDDLTIKREMEAGGGRIRVMTVHGSKGLEAPIVILPDCSAPNRTIRDSILTDADVPFWKQGSEVQPARQRAAMATRQEADARERDRLLYVAMTRAECWLTVAAIDDLGKEGDDWYSQVAAGMAARDPVPQVFDFGDYGAGDGLVLGDVDWSHLPMTPTPKSQAAEVVVPDWVAQPAATPERPPQALRPSDLGGAKALPGAEGEETEAAMARGTVLHTVLEYLPLVPRGEQAATARALIARLAADVPEMEQAVWSDECVACVNAPDLAALFVSDAMTEVPISGEVPGLGQMSGVIDRLIVTPDRVIAVDFKTNRAVPRDVAECPEGLLRQMGAYRALLAKVYPQHAIETGFLWTYTASYMALPHDLVTAAIERAHLDLGAVQT